MQYIILQLEKENKNTHRGQILHEAAKQHPNSIKDIAEAAGYKYGTFFKHIKNKDLSYTILAKYGKVMNRDFSVEFPEMVSLPSFATQNNKRSFFSEDELKEELEELRKSYVKVLEKHNSLLESNIIAKEEISKLTIENQKLREENTFLRNSQANRK